MTILSKSHLIFMNLYSALFVLLLESVLFFPSSLLLLLEVTVREKAGELLMPLVAGKGDTLKALPVL